MKTLQERIDEAQKQGGPRFHLGVSTLGTTCERRMWYNFRWISPEVFPGRILRLFETGNLYESRAVNYLKDIGMDVRLTGRNQQRVSFGGHVSGSCDGVIYGEQGKMILEIKTHSLKSFDETLKKGAKAEHIAQMQGYMLGLEIDRGLYFAVCKDDDRIYTQEVELDKERAERLVRRAQYVAKSRTPTQPISTDPTWYECKFCPAHAVCHGAPIQDVNCRTCKYGNPESGEWVCEKFGGVIPNDFQVKGCDSHEFMDRENDGHLSRNMVKEGFDIAEPWLKVMGGEIET